MQTLFFFDERLIHKAYKLSRHLHHPRKVEQNPVLTATEDWESLLCTYGSVLHDEGLFKAYYTMWWLQDVPPYSCLAEGLAYAYSHDGIHWIKPHLQIVPEVNGGRNNLIRYGMFADQPCVLRLQEPVQGKRYVMAYYGDFPPLGPGVRICFSEDGVHWDWPGSLVWKTAIDAVADKLDFYAADDTISFYFDPKRRTYVLLRKVMQDTELVHAPKRHADWRPDRERLQRMIARCESDDLIHWREHRVILAPDRDDPPSVDFHRLGVTPYGDHSLGLLEVHDGEPGRNSIAIDLCYSQDGLEWTRPCRRQQPFIANGQAGAWDSGVLFTPPQFVTCGEDLFIFYGGMEARLTAEAMGKCKRYGVGLAKLEKDRFCSLRAPPHESGLLLTQPLAIREYVAINARIDAQGLLQAALCDQESSPIPGFGWTDNDPIRGEPSRALLTWNNRPLPAPGTYRLSIRARAADLFALHLA
jgi:predicted GH43/DUF377 family glycosyl hydrolase